GAGDLLDTLDELVGVVLVLGVQVGVVRLDLGGQVLALAVEALEVRAAGHVVEALRRGGGGPQPRQDPPGPLLELAHLGLNPRRVNTDVTGHTGTYPPDLMGAP